jgi:UDP-glucose 4-epimerase
MVYNLGSGVLGTPQDVAAALARAIPGASVDILDKPVIGPYWRHEQILDLSRAREDLGYAPAFDVSRGVADFAADLRAAPN